LLPVRAKAAHIRELFVHEARGQCSHRPGGFV